MYLVINNSMRFFRHAGLEEPAPYLIRGHPEGLESSGCARSLGSLRLPPVARLEFTPMKIGAGMPLFMRTAVYGQTQDST